MNSRAAMMTLALVLLTVFATAFALINYQNRVTVWPLAGLQPLTLVIGVAFGLGACGGALLVSLLHHHRTSSPAPITTETIPTVTTH